MTGEVVGSAPSVKARRLTKHFGRKIAVDDISFEIERGAIFGLIGPNGAGKTTTFSMLGGYTRPTSGQVEVLGFPPGAVERLRGRVGILPQDAMLPASDSVGEFLVHMARLQNIPARKAVESARRVLDDVAGAAWWSERCASLSHGMAKRVALAQAFLGAPDVVFLDEPTAGLDPRAAFETRQIIKSKKGRSTIVISSHNLQELEEVCDAAAILDRGRLISAGSMAELTSSNEEVRFKVAPGTARGAARGEVPVDALRQLAIIKAFDFDEDRLELTVAFDPKRADAETVIGHVLRALLDHEVRISGVTKGRSLEERVIRLT